MATSLESLGWLYAKQGKAAEAEPLLKRTLAIFRALSERITPCRPVLCQDRQTLSRHRSA